MRILVLPCDGIILGTTSHMDCPKPEKGGRNPSAALRVGLDLYCNARPALRARTWARAPGTWASSSCARPPRASTPTATCSRAEAR